MKLSPALRPSVTCGGRDEWCEVYGDGDDDGGGHGALQCHLVEKNAELGIAHTYHDPPVTFLYRKLVVTKPFSPFLL